MHWVLEIGLMGLLVATLVHLLRLSRALAILKRDRGPLEELLAGFAASTREAHDGIDHLRETADHVGRRLAQQTEVGSALRDDLAYMVERAERLADRLDHLVRQSRPFEQSRSFEQVQRHAAPQIQPAYTPAPARAEPMESYEPPASSPKMRSQAERDLLQALRLNK